MANAKLKQAVHAALVPIIGADLQQAAVLIASRKAAAKKPSGAKTGKGKVIVQDGVDFEALGVEIADLFLGSQDDYKAELKALQMQERVTRGMIWLAAAEKVSTPEQAKTLVDSFKAHCEAKGHKRAGPDASDFKAFIMAHMVSRDEVIGVLAESDDYHAAMKEIRAIRDTGKAERHGNTNRKQRAPNDRTMSKVMHYIGGMTVAQLTMIYKAGKSRAAVLRKSGEMFEAFK